ncbi:MAG: zeta toxin family protein [Lachnospiraceae bacterium]|nr:zeta toxin family protein [Lachnospiraceae bacterium]
MGENIRTNDEGEETALGKVGGFLYDAGMGMADSATNMALAMGNPFALAGLTATQAGASSAYDVASRGGTVNQMAATGLASALAEGISEAISLGNLKSLKTVAKSGGKGLLEAMGKQALVEGTEEGTSELLNKAADYLINKDLSASETQYRQYIADGMSEEEARKKVNDDIFADIMKSIGMGAISGGVFGAGANILGGATNTQSIPVLEKTEVQTETQAEIPVLKAPQEQAQIGAETVDTANLPPIEETGLEKAQNDNDGVMRLVTGQPVSQDLQETINKLSKNEDVDYDYIMDIPEIDEAEARAEAKMLNGESISINTPERTAMRDQVVQELLSRGSWQVDSKGKGAYNGVVERGKQVVFVIGLPASGKSSATANPISQHYKARIIDSDDAKTSSVFAEDYDNGYGAGYLHEESKNIAESVLAQSIANGDNIVLPIIGADFDKLVKKMRTYADMGYETTLVLNELPSNKALGRALSRFVEEGRYIPLDILAGYGNKPTEVYERIMRGEGNARPNNYARVSNDVTRGSKPQTIESGGKCQEVYGSGRTSGGERNQDARRNGSQVQGSTSATIPEANQTLISHDAELRKRSYNDTIVHKTDLPEVIKNEFISNPQMYEVLKNKTTQEQAQSLVDSLSTDDAIVQFNRLADAKNPVSVPMGRLLSRKLNAEGRTGMAVEVLRTMSTKLTEAGQFAQAAAIELMDSDPVMALQYVTRELDDLNQKGREKFGDKWTDFELTEAEKETFSKIEVGDTEAIKKAYEGIFNRIRKQYPSTMMEKLTEYRRVAMLLNTRTNVRNIVSNAMLLPVRWTSDRISALGQNAIHLFKPEYQRTQSLVVGKESKKLAHDAWETVKEVMLGDEGKYEDSTQAVRDKQVFKGSKFASYIDNVTNGAITRANNAMGKDIDPSMMETARNLTYFLLKKGDDVFVQKNFEQRLASYIEAQGITSVEDIPADAITLAQQEALKATFKDDTALARTLTGIKKNTGIFGEALLPFTKTPANLAMRGYDYSIGGYIDMFKTLANKKRTQADVSKMMDSLSKSVLGTAGIYAGYLLAKSGIITGALSDDDEEQAFQKKMGMLPYAIKVGDNYYTYDWAQPASIPIILGASIYQSTEESDNLLNTWSQAGMAATDAWFNLSPVQNLQDIFGGYGTISENILGTLADMPASLIPAQLGALTRVGDTTQRQTYSNGDFWGSRIDSIKSKIPVLSETLPASYDTWGNEIKRSDTTAEAAFAQLISPGQLGNSNVTQIDDEIMRLYQSTGNNGVFPLKADWSYTINGTKVALDNVSYSLMQQSMGESAYELAETFINSSGYSDLGDETKAKVLSDLYSFARALAKSKQLGYDIANGSEKTLYQIYLQGGAQSVVNYKIYKLQADANGNGSVSAEEATNYFNGMNSMPRSEKAYWFDTLNGSKNNPFK